MNDNERILSCMLCGGHINPEHDTYYTAVDEGPLGLFSEPKKIGDVCESCYDELEANE